MGNTDMGFYGSHGARDHPHIHGEYLCQLLRAIWDRGSPPHTWGILARLLLRNSYSRITPTYMGNTENSFRYPALNQDHPHIHGEYSWILKNASKTQGSPPHTWGIRIMRSDDDFYVRITPTYMGNTHLWCRQAGTKRDHPHIHGEYG